MSELEMLFAVRKEIRDLQEYTRKRINILLVKLIKIEKDVNKEDKQKTGE